MECEYEVSVTFHSLSNPGGNLASGSVCDRGRSQATSCDTYVSFCLKALTEASMNTITDLPGICGSRSRVISTRAGATTNIDSVTFNETVFGLPNPVSLFGPPPEVRVGRADKNPTPAM